MLTISNNVINMFFNDKDVIDIVSYGNGHINNTYLVSTTCGKFILQQVNGDVFNIENLVDNYKYLVNCSANFSKVHRLFPKFIPNKSGSIHSIDNDGSAWRLNEFIDNSSAYSISPNSGITKNAGMAMGKFQLFLSELNIDSFKDTIPDFHNPVRRLNEFENILANANDSTIETALKEIKIALTHKSIATDMMELNHSKVLPQRITHNDTKLENILFDNLNDHTYVIDLDTVMKGSILFDFGDMVRSIVSLSREDERDLDRVTFNTAHFEALCDGYLSEIKSIITSEEKENILLGILSILYEQGLRFLTDYLSGNKYYKVDYPTHNLIRCRTQFKLLEQVIKNKSVATRIINTTLQ